MENCMSKTNLHTEEMDAPFLIQAGFVEGVTEHEKTYPSIRDMYESLFENNKEFCFIKWSYIPFRLSYNVDLPGMISSLIKFLQHLFEGSINPFETTFQSNNVNFSVKVSEAKNSQINIEGKFTKTYGGHQDVLNSVPKITVDKKLFLCEWKLILEQLVTSFNASKSSLSSDSESAQMATLIHLNKMISERPLRYQYDMR